VVTAPDPAPLYWVTITDRSTLDVVTTVEATDIDHAIDVACYWREAGFHTRAYATLPPRSAAAGDEATR
jgi:hypothetical protein